MLTKKNAELEDRVGEPLGAKTARRVGDERSVSETKAFATLRRYPRKSASVPGALDARGFAVDETRYLERFFRRPTKPPSTLWRRTASASA